MPTDAQRLDPHPTTSSRLAVALLLVAAACGSDRVAEPGVGEGSATGAGGSTDTLDSAPMSSTSEADPSRDSGAVADSTGSRASDTAFDDDDTTDDDGAALPDVPGFPEECYEPEATIDATSSETPNGTIEIDEAWLELDACYGPPHLLLAQSPSIENGPYAEIDVALFISAEAGGPYTGVHPATLWGTRRVEGTIELLDPFHAPELGVPDANARLHGQLEVHAGGWDLSVEVDLICCGDGDCYCPCR